MALYIGCDKDLANQANGIVRMVQAGYRKQTASEQTIHFARSTEPRMSLAARWFARLVDDLLSYKRAADDPSHTVAAELGYGAAEENDQSMALTVAIYQEGQYADTFFLDNTLLYVTNILWEFSPDGGTTWYPMFEVLPEPWHRMVLPSPTDKVSVRATSNNVQDWIQTFTVKPIPHYASDASL